MQLYFIDRSDLEKSAAFYKSHIDAQNAQAGFQIDDDDNYKDPYIDPLYVLLESVNQGMKQTYKIKAFYWYLTHALEACQLHRRRSSTTDYYVNSLVIRESAQGGK